MQRSAQVAVENYYLKQLLTLRLRRGTGVDPMVIDSIEIFWRYYFQGFFGQSFASVILEILFGVMVVFEATVVVGGVTPRTGEGKRVQITFPFGMMVVMA